MMLITTLVVSFLVRCMLEVSCRYAGVVSGLQAKEQLVLQPAVRTLLQAHRVPAMMPPTTIFSQYFYFSRSGTHLTFFFVYFCQNAVFGRCPCIHLEVKHRNYEIYVVCFKQKLQSVRSVIQAACHLSNTSLSHISSFLLHIQNAKQELLITWFRFDGV